MAHSNITVFPSAARTVTTNSNDMQSEGYKGAWLVLNITAVTGTLPTLTVKLQGKDPLSAIYVDLPGAVFVEKTGISTDSLVLYPGIAETANRIESQPLPHPWRAVATIGGTGGPSFTFSLAGSLIV